MAEEYPDLWVGKCRSCESRFEFTHAELVENYPDQEPVLSSGEFEANCPCGDSRVLMERTHVKAVPFSAWQVLPAATGCPECGVDHEPEMPHDPSSMLYQYRFRSQEAKAGREERWPTWTDAMAHCTPNIQRAWTQALAHHGVNLD